MRSLSLLFFIVFFNFEMSAQSPTFGLQDFYTYNSELEYTVDSIYHTLSERQQVAQMIISSAGELGKPMTTVKKLTANDAIGGVVFLKGKKKTHTESINALNQISIKNGTLPLLFSMDAEPSLFASRIKGAKDVGKTIDIKTEAQSDAVVNTINTELREIGVHHNYAPVLDISAKNEAIKSRSYGNDKDTVIRLANQFIRCTHRWSITRSS